MTERTASKGEIRRREFLRRAVATGVAVAWAVPVVQTVGASPAFAHTGSPCNPHNCFFDEGCNGGCMGRGACGGKCGSDQCGGRSGPCYVYCKKWNSIHRKRSSACCNPGLCNPKNFTCAPGHNSGGRHGGGGTATYTGSLIGCT